MFRSRSSTLKSCSLKIAIFSSFFGICILGCQQNPYADHRTNIQKAELPTPEKPVNTLSAEYLSVTTIPEVLPDFFEGTKSDFRISARSLLAGSEAGTLRAMNIDQFPGASFDPKTGIFSWTPPLGTLRSFQNRTLTLDVEFSVPGNAKIPILSTQEHISIRVNRTLIPPEIKSLKLGVPDANLIEGRTYPFVLKIADRSLIGFDGDKPLIVVKGLMGSHKIPMEIVWQDMRATNTALGEWELSGSVLLGYSHDKAEIRKQSIRFVAVSKTGQSSDELQLDLSISPTPPELSLRYSPGATLAYPGQNYHGIFWISVPELRGFMETEDFRFQINELPGEAHMSCTPGPGSPTSSMLCQLDWKVPEKLLEPKEASANLERKALQIAFTATPQSWVVSKDSSAKSLTVNIDVIQSGRNP